MHTEWHYFWHILAHIHTDIFKKRRSNLSHSMLRKKFEDVHISNTYTVKYNVLHTYKSLLIIQTYWTCMQSTAYSDVSMYEKTDQGNEMNTLNIFIITKMSLNDVTSFFEIFYPSFPLSTNLQNRLMESRHLLVDPPP